MKPRCFVVVSWRDEAHIFSYGSYIVIAASNPEEKLQSGTLARFKIFANILSSIIIELHNVRTHSHIIHLLQIYTLFDNNTNNDLPMRL